MSRLGLTAVHATASAMRGFSSLLGLHNSLMGNMSVRESGTYVRPFSLGIGCVFEDIVARQYSLLFRVDYETIVDIGSHIGTISTMLSSLYGEGCMPWNRTGGTSGFS